MTASFFGKPGPDRWPRPGVAWASARILHPLVCPAVSWAPGRVRLRLLCIGSAIGLLIGAPAVRADPAIAVSAGAAATIDRFGAFVAEAAQRFGIPALWIRAVMRIESGGNARALSPKGAMGLMQLMPSTWADLRVRYGLGVDPFDPHDNIAAGAAYLRELHDRYGAPGFLAAYNAGPARYDDYLATGRALPAETRAYVAALASLFVAGSAGRPLFDRVARASWTVAPLFAGRTASGSAAPPTEVVPLATGSSAQGSVALAPRSAGLFVTQSARKAQP